MNHIVRPLLCFLFLAATATAQIATDSNFRTIVLTEEFHSEGSAVADLDQDGHVDVISGPYWYQGPKFERRFAFAQVNRFHIKEYSDHFFSFTWDFNSDGAMDILSIPIPGKDAYWYENPGLQKGRSSNVGVLWQKHLALSSVDGESPGFEDIDGDSVPELICMQKGDLGYAQYDRDKPKRTWSFKRISAGKSFGRFTHGLGIGDINGDELLDLIETNGWWQQPSNSSREWKFHAQRFASGGGAQMFAYDFDGDGDADVVSSQNAHGYGLSWFERRGTGEDYLFVEHPIVTDKPSDNAYGLALSQMHALALEDMDGDGTLDLVTGKRFFAHGGKDPGAFQPPVLVWFRTVRKNSNVSFEPHLIHARSGVGAQVTLADVDNNGRIDVLVGNKLGTFLSLNMSASNESAMPIVSGRSGNGVENFSLIGTDAFSKHVRETEPLSAAAERDTFELPTGFEVQLVASEPDIAKPMNMAFDARGRLWVSSSFEYPYPAPPDRKGKDTIKILEDTDGDGKADKVTTFADGLNIPMGLYPYKDGVVCFSIPNILLLRDLDGDDRCDKREVLYGPFDTSRDTHGMCNAFTRGFDGWLYACHGFNNRSVVAGSDRNQVTMQSGNTFRLQLDGSRIEHFTHGQVNPFGLAIRPNGELFSADCHTKPITLLMQDGYYESFGKPHDGLGFVPNVMEHLHGSTGIAGIAFYDAKQFPSEYQGNAFGGNVMTGRVNRNSIRRVGSTSRAFEESDFLVSSDPWFRPVDVQVGPDGALYVADFYNRIIGHYEVDLDHPGRDRHRGRIWRIVYTGSQDRLNAHVQSQLRNVEKGSALGIEACFARLSSSNASTRMRATDEIVDRFGTQAETQASALLHSGNPYEVVHAAWILERCGALTQEHLGRLLVSPSELVRTHAFKILTEHRKRIDGANELVRNRLLSGLRDSDASVKRAAATASAVLQDPELALELLRLSEVSSQDVHLIHAIKIALKKQLSNQNVFSGITSRSDLAPPIKSRVCELCLAIRTDFAGEYLASNIGNLEVSDEELAEYVKLAASYASSATAVGLISDIRRRLSDRFALQERLARSILAGLRSRGEAIPDTLLSWASSLAQRRFGSDIDDQRLPIVWKEFESKGVDLRSGAQPTWLPSTRRNSEDGPQKTLLYSSFLNGEKKTGVYRSAIFTLPDRFEFFVAGHDGYPDQSLQKQNFIRLFDAESNRLLKEWSPPRNDTAKRIVWETGGHKRKKAYVELVDGDSAGAYAWLAVGRFNVPELNPSSRVEDWTVGAELVADFQLNSKVPVVAKLLKLSLPDPKLAQRFGEALADIRKDNVDLAFARALGFNNLSAEMRVSLVNRIINGREAEADLMTLGKLCEVSSFSRQNRIAESLTQSLEGLELLVSSIESGKAAPRLLVEPTLRTRIEALIRTERGRAFEDRVLVLSNSVKTQDQAHEKQVQLVREGLKTSLGDIARGHALFSQKCASCHQVNGVGKQVGPNLDGIGHRGVDRLVEDVLQPNQNVDKAFRSTVVLTEDGKVYNGLLRQIDGGELLLVNQEGQEIQIPKSIVETKSESPVSPMPSNFSTLLNVQQAKDLFAYLVSLKN